MTGYAQNIYTLQIQMMSNASNIGIRLPKIKFDGTVIMMQIEQPFNEHEVLWNFENEVNWVMELMQQTNY